jgi:hypothetical protein
MAKDKLPETAEKWAMSSHSMKTFFQITDLTVAGKIYFRLAAINPAGIDFTPVLKGMT